jgi:hypothetical protein
MNPSPILIIRNTFPTLILEFQFSLLIKSENTKTYLLSCNHIKNPKTPLPYHFSCILVIFTLLHCNLFYCISYFILLTFNTLCLTTTGWSWGRKTRRLFCRWPDKNEESFYDCSPRVQYKSRVSSWGKLSLALYTWSPNKVAHCLVSSPPHYHESTGNFLSHPYRQILHGKLHTVSRETINTQIHKGKNKHLYFIS